jgi:hypothetical protein
MVNAKIMKGSKMGRRVRSFGRWGVWVCTGMLIAAILVSIWIEPGVYISHEFNDQRQSVKPRSIHLARGRLVCYSEYPSSHFDMPHSPANRVSDPGWRVHFRQGFTGVGLWNGDGSWWKPRFFDDQPLAWRFDFPLVYPTALMVAWSLWLLPFWKWWKRVGLDGVECQYCGYSLDGLDSERCPECGEAYGAA